MIHSKFLFVFLVAISLVACGNPPQGNNDQEGNQAPQVNITSAEFSNTASYTLRATISDDDAVTALSYVLNGGPVQDVVPVVTTLNVALNLNLGDNLITVTAQDKEGKIGSDQIIVNYDPELEAGGNLNLSVTGLPAGQAADITVLIPGIYVNDVGESKLIEQLRPDDYTIQARNVTIGSSVYVADPPQQQVAVLPSETANASVSYTRQNPEAGSLALTIAGLPVGASANVTVTGPGGFTQILDASKTLLNLAPGDYTISAVVLSSNGISYTPNPETQTISVVFGQTSYANITFSGPETGALELTILGLPDTVPARVTLTNQAGISQNLTSNETLSNLTPGVYRLESAPVPDDQLTYLPDQNKQTLTVIAGETTPASVTYSPEEASTGSLNITIEGLPEGSTARVLVVDSASSQRQELRRVESSTTLNNLPAGTYTVVAEVVKPDSATFSPDTRNQNIEVRIGETQEVNVRYTCDTIKPPDAGLEKALRDSINPRPSLQDTLELSSGDGLNCAKVAQLHALYASSSGIRDPELEGLQYAKKLERIFLRSNALIEISVDTFSEFTKLNALYLQGNRLTSLPEGLFAGLANLKILDLSDNELTLLPEGFFANLKQLESLNLDSNKLTVLSEGLLSGLSNLEALYLEENQLTTLPTRVFSGLTKLQWLDLDSNGLTTLPSGVFSRLTNLRDLFLYDNQLRSLPEGVFADLTNLDSLQLNVNQFNTLGNDPFSGLAKLRILRLDKNQLNTLSLRWFSGLENLDYLYLDDNCLRLDKVPVAGVLASLKVPTVDTDGNPRTDLTCPAIGPTTNTFTHGAEGWRVDGNAPGWNSSGYLSVSLAQDDYMTSPGTYTGDASAYYGRKLTFDVRQSGSGLPRNCCDVLLESGSYLLSYSLPDLPGSDWSTMTVPLEVDPEWRYGGNPATEQQLKDALADLKSVKIMWRYNSAATASGELDNIVFGTD